MRTPCTLPLDPPLTCPAWLEMLCLVLRPQFYASVIRFGSRDTSPKSIDRKGLGESRTGTRQGNARAVTVVYKWEELRNIINYFVVNMAISYFVFKFPLAVIPETLSATANGSWRWVIARIGGGLNWKPCVDRCMLIALWLWFCQEVAPSQLFPLRCKLWRRIV